MLALVNYGPIKSGESYRILRVKNDWVLMISRGKSIYVPKWVFE